MNSSTSLDQWLMRIQDKEMPIFGKTVQAVLSVAEDGASPASKLAQVILRDASMTARVLKLVNTIYYNPSRNPISTVSRAVVLMGFEHIRNICLSISLVDSLVSGDVKDLLTQELSRAIHAAVQAKDLALQAKDPAPEEIFVATLLHNIGDMAFWCFGGDAAHEVAHLLEQPGYTPEQAQLEILGFLLQELTTALVKEWGINKLLLEVMDDSKVNNPRLQLVRLSHELARLTETHGWDAEEVKQLQEKTAKLLNMDLDSLEQQQHDNAQQAVRIASYYGAKAAAQTIPTPGRDKSKLEVEPETETVQRYPEPDPMLQLHVLRELSQVARKKAGFGLVAEMILEGIHRGIGLDRVLLALVSVDRKALVGKLALGPDSDSFLRNFHFSLVMDPDNLFFDVLEQQGAHWVEPSDRPWQAGMTPAISRVIGTKPFFVATLVVKGKNIGLIYADRSLSDRLLDEESFDSFKHFTTEAGLVLGQNVN